MAEEVLLENEKELAGFARGEITTITPVLTRVLEEIKQNGVPYYDWTHMRALLGAKAKLAVEQVRTKDKSITAGAAPTASLDERVNSIAAMLDGFESPPFTLQRLVEVIMEPEKSYKSLAKLLNALEKLLAVTSTLQVVDPRTPPASADDNEPPLPPALTVDVNPAAPPAQAIQANLQLDPVARAPWAGGVAPAQ